MEPFAKFIETFLARRNMNKQPTALSKDSVRLMRRSAYLHARSSKRSAPECYKRRKQERKDINQATAPHSGTAWLSLLLLTKWLCSETRKRAHPDLNQGPADLQSAALTTELCTQCQNSPPTSAKCLVRVLILRCPFRHHAQSRNCDNKLHKWQPAEKFVFSSQAKNRTCQDHSFSNY